MYMRFSVCNRLATYSLIRTLPQHMYTLTSLTRDYNIYTTDVTYFSDARTVDHPLKS